MQRRNERFVERLPLVLDRPWHAYALTILFCAAALLIRLGAEELLPLGYPFISFFPAVILTAFFFGVRAGIFAAVLGGLASWYVFIPPRMTFAFNPSVAMALCLYVGVVAIEIWLIHFLQQANYNLAVERERSRVLAENRELLFHELQHRVSNNLQVVAAMLALQRRSITDEAARRALDDASARLALIGRISRALYDPSGQGKDMKDFLAMLCADLLDASGRRDIACTVAAPEGLRLEPAVTVPLALIVAEAVSNAIEHGLPDRAGAVVVALEKEADGTLALQIRDDGRGLPAGGTGEGGSQLGLRIAHALAAQLGGAFRLEPVAGGGAAARLELPPRAA